MSQKQLLIVVTAMVIVVMTVVIIAYHNKRKRDKELEPYLSCLLRLEGNILSVDWSKDKTFLNSVFTGLERHLIKSLQHKINAVIKKNKTVESILSEARTDSFFRLVTAPKITLSEPNYDIFFIDCIDILLDLYNLIKENNVLAKYPQLSEEFSYRIDYLSKSIHQVDYCSKDIALNRLKRRYAEQYNHNQDSMFWDLNKENVDKLLCFLKNAIRKN